MKNNAQSLQLIHTQLQQIHNLALDWNGAYGSEPIQKLLNLYGEIFQHITSEVLPQMGLSTKDIEDLLATIERR